MFVKVQKRALAREQEIQRKAEAAEQKRLKTLLEKEADYYGLKIIKVAFNRGFRHVLRGVLEPNILELLFSGKEVVKHLKFTHVCMEESRLWFRIDADDLPTPITLADLRHEDFLDTLEIALKRPVKYFRSTRGGAFFVVERDGSIAGIPTYVPMSTAFNWIPAEADPLSFCVGLAENRRPLIASLSTLPHLLIAGNTRAGKSVCINNIVSTLTARDPAAEKIQLVLIDMKRGVELGLYRGIPHLFDFGNSQYTGIAYTPDEAKVALQAIINEMERRYSLFGPASVRDLDEYNKTVSEPLPRLVVIVDELAKLLFSMDKELVKMGRILLNEVLSLGAAAGIHCVICTQDPSREILPRHLKTNCPARVCFSTPSIPGSIAVLENKKAYKLSPRGRGIFQFGDVEEAFQGPMINTAMVKRHVKKLIAWANEKQLTTKRYDVGLIDLFEYAIQARAISDTEYSLAWEPLVQKFGELGGSANKVKDMLKSADNREFIIEGNIYTVKNSLGAKGRRLILIGPIEEPPVIEDINLLAAD